MAHQPPDAGRRVPDAAVRILHLSDIHFRSGTAWDADPVLRALARFIAHEVAAGLAPDLVAITGDLAFAGKAEEYALATGWLRDQLWPALTPSPGRPLPRDRLLLVPGNHDVDRSKVDAVAQMVQDGLLAGGDQNRIATVLADSAQREVLLERHADYLAFYGDWLGEPQPLPWWQRVIPIGHQRLHVAGLDSAWMSSGDADRGRLLLGRWQIHQTIDTREAEGADWRIALMHHPWDYLAEFDGGEARQAIHLHRDLVLRGHLHEGDTSLLRPPDPARACLELAAGCVYDERGFSHPNAFHWIELYPEPRRVRVLFRVWNKGVWQVDRNQPGCGEGVAEIPMQTATASVTPERLSEAGPAPSRKGRARPAKPSGGGAATIRQGTQSTPPKKGPPNGGDRRCDVLLLYVNDREREGIIGAFKGPRGGVPKPRTIDGLPCLDLRTIKGRRVLALATNMGSATPGGSATVTHDAIKKLNPEWIIAVGIAFGMDPEKTPIGTILVSDRVSCYEPQRVGKGKTIRRGDTVTVDYYLLQHLRTVSGKDYWNGAEVCVGELLSGEKLIDDPGFKGKLRKAYPEARGGEMEAAGIYSAAMLDHRAWIVVKAVCDFADGNKGEDKEARQRLAAANAAAFVRHCLGAWGSAPAPSPSPAPANKGFSGPAPFATPRVPGPNLLRADALDGIAESLDILPSLREALVQRIPGAAPATPAVQLASLLCPRQAQAFADALGHFRLAVNDAKRLVHHRQGDIQTLRNRAHDILGWMLVTTVMTGYDSEEAPAVKAWLNGAAFHVPIGRSVCLEVISATWLKRKAQFSVEKGRRLFGRDEINPEGSRLGDIGFDDPYKIREGAVVNEVWRLIYQKIYAEPAPLIVDAETKDRLRTRLRIQLNDYRRRLRLVVDPRDLRDPLAMPAALDAIGREIPWLHLMVVSPDHAAQSTIFLMPAGELAGEIEECVAAIESLLSPSA